jgi:hypothetical protein
MDWTLMLFLLDRIFPKPLIKAHKINPIKKGIQEKNVTISLTMDLRIFLGKIV